MIKDQTNSEVIDDQNDQQADSLLESNQKDSISKQNIVEEPAKHSSTLFRATEF